MGVKRIIGGSFEFAGETAKKAAQVVPDVLGGMLEQAVKGGQQTAAQKQQVQQQMQKKVQDFQKKDEEELKKAREALVQLRKMQSQFAPKPQKELRPYEQNVRELEEKKAMETEAQKKQQAQALPVMSQKPQRGSLLKKKAKGIEGLAKDSKTG